MCQSRHLATNIGPARFRVAEDMTGLFVSACHSKRVTSRERMVHVTFESRCFFKVQRSHSRDQIHLGSYFNSSRWTNRNLKASPGDIQCTLDIRWTVWATYVSQKLALKIVNNINLFMTRIPRSVVRMMII